MKGFHNRLFLLAGFCFLEVAQSFTLPISKNTKSRVCILLNSQDLNDVVTTTSETEPATIDSISNEISSSSNCKSGKVALVIAPAQFCVPADYQKLINTLKESNKSIITAKVAPLPRTEWIKVAQQLPTQSFFNATLNNAKTLKWYFDAIENSLAEIYNEVDEDTTVCIIAHSIGGWVARAYLGGLSQSSTAVYRTTLERCSSLITLGTPHYSPNTALVDQTRGLLREVESTYACSAQGLLDNGITVTCVGSTGVKSNLMTTDIEEIVATTSYLPLVEKWSDIIKGIEGDGIIPKELAFMESPANKIEVKCCTLKGNPVRHAHVLPTPWNLIDGSAPSIPLSDDFTWYGSDGVVDQWIDAIQ
mmetsp:Transcript_25314/g.31194  ORF Transcript_25314/g.31194 Transcript_25314/m.31194 type:complete len:362 (+) Transcript_25314:77-1162(+)